MTALPGAEMFCRGIASMPQKKNVFEKFTVLTSAAVYPKCIVDLHKKGTMSAIAVYNGNGFGKSNEECRDGWKCA